MITLCVYHCSYSCVVKVHLDVCVVLRVSVLSLLGCPTRVLGQRIAELQETWLPLPLLPTQPVQVQTLPVLCCHLVRLCHWVGKGNCFGN